MQTQEIRRWMVTNYKGDYMPAFVVEKDGRPELVVHGEDFTGMTKDEAWSVATKRNVGQVKRAEDAVERLRQELAEAEAHLARVKVALPYRL